MTATVAAQDKGKGKQAGPPPPLKFTVAAFTDGGEVPQKFTCSAGPTAPSPAMTWDAVPAGTQSFALIMHDPDPVINKSSTDVLHWAIFNIPGNLRQLPENVATSAELPDGSRQLNNIAGRSGYLGPCPPPPAPHHYTLELYALDQKLNLPATASRADLLKAMDGHVMTKAVYVGMFHR
jgi:hypothetical protein